MQLCLCNHSNQLFLLATPKNWPIRCEAMQLCLCNHSYVHRAIGDSWYFRLTARAVAINTNMVLLIAISEKWQNDFTFNLLLCTNTSTQITSFPGHSQILSRSRGEKSGEMVDSTSKSSPPFLVRDVVLIPGLLPIFLHGCEIKSGSGLGTRLAHKHIAQR